MLKQEFQCTETKVSVYLNHYETYMDMGKRDVCLWQAASCAPIRMPFVRGTDKDKLRSCFEFLQKVFLGLMYPFSCVLWAINSKQLLMNSQ